MFQEILAENGTKFVVAAVVVLLGLACLALVMWIVRGRPSSPFIRGGRNRTPRLAVLDAAAIDTRRRLVLVRRDDVEHLVMIGGPTDIVIESRIVTAPAEAAPAVAQAVRAEPVAKAAEPPPVAARPPAPVAAERRPPATPEGVSAMGKVLYAEPETPVRAAPAARPAAQQPAVAARPAETPQRAPESRAEAMLDQARQRVLATPQPAAAAATTQRPVNTPATAARPAAAVDNPALVSEFEKMLEAEMASTARAAPQKAETAGQPAARSREEAEAEMARLLGEIAANRKS